VGRRDDFATLVLKHSMSTGEVGFTVLLAAWIVGCAVGSILVVLAPVLVALVAWPFRLGRLPDEKAALDIEHTAIACLVFVFPLLFLGSRSRPWMHEIEVGGGGVLAFLSLFGMVLTLPAARVLTRTLPAGRRWRLLGPALAVALVAVTALVLAELSPSRWTSLDASGAWAELPGFGDVRIAQQVGPATRAEPCELSKELCGLLKLRLEGPLRRSDWPTALLLETRGVAWPKADLIGGDQAWVSAAGYSGRPHVCSVGPWRGECALLGRAQSYPYFAVGPIARSWFVLPAVAMAVAAALWLAARREKRKPTVDQAAHRLAGARADAYRAMALLGLVYLGTPFVVAAWTLR
jgi:hypothetical protein